MDCGGSTGDYHRNGIAYADCVGIFYIISGGTCTSYNQYCHVQEEKMDEYAGVIKLKGLIDIYDIM